MKSTFYIYRVTTFANTGKTQKGKILQEYVNFLENTLIEGKAPVQALIDNLVDVVDHLNKQFPSSKEWRVTSSNSQIHIEPKDNARRSFDSQALAVINYGRVRQQLSPSDLGDMFSSMVDTYSHLGTKGGAR